MDRRTLYSLIIAALVAHLALFLPLPLVVQAIAALIVAGLLPGALLVEALVGQSEAPPARAERLLYAIGAGYATMVFGMLAVSYLPGPVTLWQTLLTFDLTTALLAAIVWWRSRPNHQSPITNHQLSYWFIAGFLILLLTGSFFRLVNLGYAEFQGDEARATLRAAAVIQGEDEVLFLHRKGPTEILLPTVIYALTGHLNETTARLPFALANVAGLFALWLLGWRLFGPLAGWIAAVFLALDGYFIGFARIVQYQSIIFLTSVLAVVIVYRLVRHPKALTRYLILTALLLATALLSHYEGVWPVIPIVFLLGVLLWQGQVYRPHLLRAIGGAALVGVALVAAFYLPFVLHPHFGATFSYLADRRISGGTLPYNNLADFFLRTTVYNTTYATLILIGLTLAALILALRPNVGRHGRILGSALLLLFLGVTLCQPSWLLLGSTDFAFVPFLAALLLIWFLPKLSVEERLLWLWLGVPLLLAFFATAKPRTHVYVFFMPWALLAAVTLARGFFALRQRRSGNTLILAGSAAALLWIAILGNYAYWYFVQNRVEVLRTWDENRPAGYWTVYDRPDDRAIFGFPLANGWKVVGALYNQGVISGAYDSNEKEAWVPAWYTRGEYRCRRTADWFFQIDNLEPFTIGDRLMMEHYLRQGFHKWGLVEVNDATRMIIYKRTEAKSEDPAREPHDGLPVYRLAEYGGVFDQMAGPQLPLVYPVIDPTIGNPLHANFSNEIWLQGYDIAYPKPLRPGDIIHLTLYWQAQQPITQSYKVFNQSYFGDGQMIAQQDGYPGCENNETWRWDPGEIITDEYDIPVNADAPDGLYPLYTGLYLEENFERLPILDETGNPSATQVHVTDIRVGEE